MQLLSCVMAHLRIGTCSWKYESWKGLVYSPNVVEKKLYICNDSCLRFQIKHSSGNRRYMVRKVLLSFVRSNAAESFHEKNQGTILTLLTNNRFDEAIK